MLVQQTYKSKFSSHFLINHHNEEGLFPQLVRQASFLWGRTPDIFRKELADRLSKTQKKVDKGLVEAAGRCFQTEQECGLLLRYIVKMNLRYAYALTAAFHILHYRPAAVNALEDWVAYGLLKIALDMMEAQRTDKKVKFRNAASLVFVLLKYRLQNGHMCFLSGDDPTANHLGVRERFEEYVDEIRGQLANRQSKMAVRTQRNLEMSRKYLEDILQYIDYRGNPSAVPLVDMEDGE